MKNNPKQIYGMVRKQNINQIIKADSYRSGMIPFFDAQINRSNMVLSKRIFLAAIFLISWLSVAVQAQEISINTMPPVVVKTVPQSGDSNVDADLEEIKITFSKDMLDPSWSLVEMSKESFPQIIGQPRFLADKRTCLVKVNLEPNKYYVIWLNTDRYTNFKDTNELSAVPYLLNFKTKEK